MQGTSIDYDFVVKLIGLHGFDMTFDVASRLLRHLETCFFLCGPR